MIKIFLFLILSLGCGFCEVSVDQITLGKSLGGWKKGGKIAEYHFSGADYRTYRPEVTPTPDGGIFISLRIDHKRGWFSSDDHAILEITVDSEAKVIAAQSNIAIQGRSITSDVIRGGAAAGAQVSGVDRAVEIGTELIADVSEKLLREKIVEAGRVSFPSVLRHNYNLLYQALRLVEQNDGLDVLDGPTDRAEKNDEKALKQLEIRPYGNP